MPNRILLLRLLILGSFLFFTQYCKQEKVRIPDEAKIDNPFNLEIDGLIAVKDTIRPNETLTDILLPHSVSMQKIHEIEKKALNVFPLREFRSGKELHIYAKWDSVETLKYFVYKINEIDHVVFDLRDSIKIYKSQRPFTTRQVEARGVITTGLIDNLQALGFSPEVGFNTADIFESRIDFGNLQPEDSFHIIFDQRFVDGEPIDIGKIYTAKITHRKKDYFAFLFEKEKPNSYYDEKGESLVGMFLGAPIKFRYRITSKYSKNRFHPVLKRSRAHLGTDYAAAHGTPIQSVGHGVVVEAAYNSGNGNYVKIKHNATYTTQYLHMSRFAKGIRRGASVSQGQIIGYVGSTGLATGPHVCFRFWKNGKQVDPLRESGRASHPLGKNFKPEFMKMKDEMMKKFGS